MEKVVVKIGRKPVICYKVDFLDMEHTIEWLIETVEHYNIKELLIPLKLVQKKIALKKADLFQP